jgi:hypothetical protein
MSPGSARLILAVFVRLIHVRRSLLAHFVVNEVPRIAGSAMRRGLTLRKVLNLLPDTPSALAPGSPVVIVI